MSALPPLVDPAALGAYLARELPGGEEAVEVERIRGGHSNETFYIRRGAEEWVLRRPPRGPLLPTAHDVAREYRVLQALTQTNVPVPRPSPDVRGHRRDRRAILPDGARPGRGDSRETASRLRGRTSRRAPGWPTS